MLNDMTNEELIARIEELEKLLRDTTEENERTIMVQRRLIDEVRAAFEQVVNLDSAIELLSPDLGDLALVFINSPRRKRKRKAAE
jgi:hypothetical protein